MADFLSQHSITIECPKCKKEFTRTIGQLKRDGNTCPNCGVGINAKQFRAEIDKAERAIRDLLK